VDPCGIGTFLKRLILSPTALVIPIPTLILVPDMFASVMPIIVVIVADGAV
jgi:hypothetical protein